KLERTIRMFQKLKRTIRISTGGETGNEYTGHKKHTPSFSSLQCSLRNHFPETVITVSTTRTVDADTTQSKK
ncbi:MAG: hypothetical protein WCB46_04595, partial [Methanoregula sp.]